MNDKEFDENEIDDLLGASSPILDEEVAELGLADSMYKLGEEILATERLSESTEDPKMAANKVAYLAPTDIQSEIDDRKKVSARGGRAIFAALSGVAAVGLAAILLLPTLFSEAPEPATSSDRSSPTTASGTTIAEPGPDTVVVPSEPEERVFTQSNGDGKTYSWDKKTTFTVENHTDGEHPDSDIYWAIIGRNPDTGNFVHIKPDGTATDATLSDNGALTRDGKGYTNYFHRLSELDTVTIAPIDSARLLLSIGSPMFIEVITDGDGKLGYVGANVENPDDPNHDIYFDFAEMAIVDELGIFINTTRVDHFGFPLRLRLEGQGGYDRTVGETESRQELTEAFVEEVPTEFETLYEAPGAPYRIIAPAHHSFNEGGEYEDYLDSYIDEVWEKYRNEDLTFTIQSGTYSGRVVGDTFTFTDEKTGTGAYKINGKPTTAMAMLGNGFLDDKTGAAGPDAVQVQLQIQAQMTAALNRRVAHTPQDWKNHDAYFPEGQRSNAYAEFWHRHSIDNLAYSFSYADVSEHSPSLHTGSPTTVTIEVGW